MKKVSNAAMALSALVLASTSLMGAQASAQIMPVIDATALKPDAKSDFKDCLQAMKFEAETIAPNTTEIALGTAGTLTCTMTMTAGADEDHMKYGLIVSDSVTKDVFLFNNNTENEATLSVTANGSVLTIFSDKDDNETSTIYVPTGRRTNESFNANAREYSSKGIVSIGYVSSDAITIRALDTDKFNEDKVINGLMGADVNLDEKMNILTDVYENIRVPYFAAKP